ncbi:unnamed protein product, partial [Prorocentrum cordatum]
GPGLEYAGSLSDCLRHFPVRRPESPRGRAGAAQEGPPPTERSAGEADGERARLARERLRGAPVVYQGRASHPRLGTNVAMQLELFSYGRRARGVWFMLGKSVDVAAERTGKWPLIVRSVGGGTRATLLGKDVALHRVAGEFFLGADGGGSFELLQCLQISLSAEPADWGSSSHCGSSCADSSEALAIQEPTGNYGVKLPVQSSGTKAPVDIFTSEAHLAEALVEVLKMYPAGIDLAQLKPAIHRSSGIWVSEALLGYKKLRDLIRSPSLSKACRFQCQGSGSRVFGCTSAVQAAGHLL